MKKPNIAFYWAASCGGCEISILEIHERIIELSEKINIVFWPCIMDVKYSDVEQFEENFIDFCFFNGAIRSDENDLMAKLLRQKSKILISYGACAGMGGIPGLSNFYPREETLSRIYKQTESTENPENIFPHTTEVTPGNEIHLPDFYSSVRALHHVVPVDYSIPGCPPMPDQTWKAFNLILSEELPPKWTILGAGDRSVCDECPFEKKNIKIKKFHRPHQVVIDDSMCLLEQGLICMGPATRSGCGAACLTARMPCRGCYGPSGDTEDQGAKMISVLGSLIDSEDEHEIRAILNDIVDLSGTVYRFGLPVSFLDRIRKPQTERGKSV